ncbi:MAG: hypothetical protein WCY84_00065 [Candidatus Cloacimonadaceae bacterium]
MEKTLNIDAAYAQAIIFFKEAIDYIEFDDGWARTFQLRKITTAFVYFQELFPELLPLLGGGNQKTKALFAKIIHWMRLMVKYGCKEAEVWLKDQESIIQQYKSLLEDYSDKAPFNSYFRDKLMEYIDANSGLVLSSDDDFVGYIAVANEYIFKDHFFVFELLKPQGMQLYYIKDTEDEKLNTEYAKYLSGYLQKTECAPELKVLENISGGTGRALSFHFPEVDAAHPDANTTVYQEIAQVFDIIEAALKEHSAGSSVKQRQPYVEITSGYHGHADIEYDMEKRLMKKEYGSCASFLTISTLEMRQEALKCAKDPNYQYVLGEEEIIDQDLSPRGYVSWDFPDDDFGKRAKEIYEKGGDDAMDEEFDYYCTYWVLLTKSLEITYRGFIIDSSIEPKMYMDRKHYQPRRELPEELRA